jgi:FkbM family methyltransferase
VPVCGIVQGARRALADLLERELDELLAEDVTAAARRATDTFDGVAGPLGTRPIVLFGAGLQGRHTAEGLGGLGAAPVAFADNNTQKWGEAIDGVPVIAPAQAAADFPEAAFIVSISSPGPDYAAIEAQLRLLGCQRVLPFAALAWRYPDVFLPHMHFAPPHQQLAHAADYRKVFDLLADDESRTLLTRYLQMQLRCDFAAMPTPDEEHYFPSELVDPRSVDIVVDCGAYDGDTLKYALSRFGPKFRRWIAFEPDPTNVELLRRNVASLPNDVAERVEVRAAAVGETAGQVRFAATGTVASAISRSGGVEVELVRLDDALADTAPTYMKFDVEGAEMSALRGCTQLIRRHRPVLAICTYHRTSDHWEIPLFVADLEPSYRLYLRLHEGYDTVLYAIPSAG